MSHDRTFASVFSVALLALPLACNNNGSNGSQATPAASSASASPPQGAPAQGAPPPPPSASASRDMRHRREQGGPAGTLFRAADDLQLTDTQKSTIETLETQLQDTQAPTKDFKSLQTDVIAGIRAGKLDNAKLQSDYAAIDAAIAARSAKEGEALSGLYAALDPGQRTALVASVRAKQAAHDAEFAAHAAIDAGAFDWTKRRLDQMTAQLGLDPGQQKSVGAILGMEDSMSPAAMKTQREEGKKRMDAVLTAFEGASFDPKKLDLAGLPGKTRHEGLEKDTTFLSQLLPLLTPEQREKLAVQRERTNGRRQWEGHERRSGDGQTTGGGGAGGPE